MRDFDDGRVQIVAKFVRGFQLDAIRAARRKIAEAIRKPFANLTSGLNTETTTRSIANVPLTGDR